MLERLTLGPCALENVHLFPSAFVFALFSNDEYIILFLNAITLLKVVFLVVPGYGLLKYVLKLWV